MGEPGHHLAPAAGGLLPLPRVGRPRWQPVPIRHGLLLPRVLGELSSLAPRQGPPERAAGHQSQAAPHGAAGAGSSLPPAPPRFAPKLGSFVPCATSPSACLVLPALHWL